MKILKLSVILFCMIGLVSCAPKNEKPLEIARVVRGNVLAELPTTGDVTPRNRLEIKPPVSGRIEQVLVEEGWHVRKGQVLAWMSSSERAALLDAAREQGTKEVKYWQDIYKPAPIVAPLTGFIIKKIAQPGQYFTVGDIALVMADRLIVEAQVDETDIGRINVGQKADIILDAYPDKTIEGYVEQIAFESDTINNVIIYRVKVLPFFVPRYFKSGMSAKVNFTMDERKNVLALPLSAVKKKGKRSYVFVKNNGDYKPLQVQTGLENNEIVEIVSGLSVGDEVVIPTAKMVQDTLNQDHPRPQMNFFGKKKS